MNKRWPFTARAEATATPSSSASASTLVLALVTQLLMAPSAHAQAVALIGVVNGVGPGTTLEVFQGAVKITDIRVGVGQKYAAALPAGVYTVKCPNGKKPKLAAYNGGGVVNINCR